ncbi:MAG: peptidase T [Firmicutes bacterium]|jgi:tripeptide aminopeptidase|nr:peptidase T [Bacillota bacterium]NLL88259.1 peptidase T [Bacillota bacterium]HKM17893.1 peptidase T [Limnochordia bacterium]
MRAYERLIKYAKFEAASDRSSDSCPSTPEQLEFGRALVEEMQSLGIKDAHMDENGYVFGTIESNIENWEGPVIGFIAHMDVARDVPFENIKPRVVENYDGGEIVLNQDESIILSPDEYPELKKYVGRDLVVTDGTTLLGADNRAGVAEIMTMAEVLLTNPGIKHGTIKIGFTPDEEIGRGADRFDVQRFGADFAYTVDGGAFGEVEYETFNAATAKITIQGRNIHPGTAKNKMKNAALIAMEFNSLLPPVERPEHTEGYEGFYHLIDIAGVVEHACLTYIIRDHDAGKYMAKKDLLNRITQWLNDKYGEATVTLEVIDSYANMCEQIKPHWHLIENAYAAVREVGGSPYSISVRGGTDGARLSFMGLPCPNLGTGSHNHHSRLEYACVQAMDDCVAMLVKLAEKYGQVGRVK